MFESIPPLLIQFIMMIGFSFIVGLEFHSYLRINQYQYGFGSTRTFVLVGILGFLLYQLNTQGLFFALGMGLLGAMLLVYYWYQSVEKHYLGMHFTPLATTCSMWTWTTIPEPQSKCVIGFLLKKPAAYT